MPRFCSVDHPMILYLRWSLGLGVVKVWTKSTSWDVSLGRHDGRRGHTEAYSTSVKILRQVPSIAERSCTVASLGCLWICLFLYLRLLVYLIQFSNIILAHQIHVDELFQLFSFKLGYMLFDFYRLLNDFGFVPCHFCHLLRVIWSHVICVIC